MGLYDSLDELYREKDALYEEKNSLIDRAKSISADIKRLYELIDNADTRSSQMRNAVAGWREEIKNLKTWRTEVSAGIDEVKSRIESVKADIRFKKDERSSRGGSRY